MGLVFMKIHHVYTKYLYYLGVAYNVDDSWRNIDAMLICCVKFYLTQT